MSVRTDRLGREFKPGSVITYPNRVGSSLWMSDSVVQVVFPDRLMVLPLHKPDGLPDPRSNRMANVWATDRITVIPGVKYYFDKLQDKYILGEAPIVEEPGE